ncbi:hypothetical protein [Streptomyces rubellomurinus]|uniref:hypothetical protein n=1 Tax=Streptomyces rubellomurinus (strain ATCC 31215) TaxID=359131 RepID=UPI000A5B79BE|nr:hypothetical protein [Streptomyces rubellomurinus]
MIVLRNRVPATGRITAADLGRLGVPAPTIRSWVHRGSLTRIGGTTRYPEFDAAQALRLVYRWQASRGEPA